MVNTDTLTAAAVNGSPRRELPAVVTFTTGEAGVIPAPGTMRALKAETGRTWEEMAGEGSDPADRFQTMIWRKLRRDYPDLRWSECADIDVQIVEVEPVDPTKRGDSETSPLSVGSGD